MKKLLLSFILIFALAGCGSQSVDKQVTSQADDSKLSPVLEPADDKKEKTIEEDNNNKQSDSKETLKASFSDNILLTSVKANDLLVSPALIEGEASVESGLVMIELRKSDHSLTSESVETVVRDGKFKIENFWFEFRNIEEGFVAVYDKDNKENIVEIPVKFQTVK